MHPRACFRCFGIMAEICAPDHMPNGQNLEMCETVLTPALDIAEACVIIAKAKLAPAAGGYIKPSEQEVDMDDGRRRFIWLCKPFHGVDIAQAENQIRRASKKQLTVDIYIRRIKEFYSLFGRPGGEHCFCKTFSTLYKGMMIHEAMDLDLLHQILIWTRVIMMGWKSLLTSYTSPGKTANITSQ